MNLQGAALWIQNQRKLKILVNKGSITITDGVTVEITGTDLVDAVTKVQEVLLTIKLNKYNEEKSND